MSRQILSTLEQVQEQRERVPVHESRDKLRVNGLDHANFHYHFVNITDLDNLDRYLRAGYKFVEKDKSGNPTSQHVDTFTGVDSIYTKGGGKGVTLALMCLPIELYNADQKLKQNRIQETEDEMRRALRRQNELRDGYVEITSELGRMRGRIPS